MDANHKIAACARVITAPHDKVAAPTGGTNALVRMPVGGGGKGLSKVAQGQVGDFAGA